MRSLFFIFEAMKHSEKFLGFSESGNYYEKKKTWEKPLSFKSKRFLCQKMKNKFLFDFEKHFNMLIIKHVTPLKIWFEIVLMKSHAADDKHLTMKITLNNDTINLLTNIFKLLSVLRILIRTKKFNKNLHLKKKYVCIFN